MSKYLTSVMNRRKTPQNEPIPGSGQVANSAGGFSFAVDDWTRLERFLILGSEGGSYYASERKLTFSNAEGVGRCIAADGARVVRAVTEVSTAGRAPKNDPAIFALAMAASFGDDATRALALGALPQVCRIGTHLFHFAEYVNGMRGWGRGLRAAVAKWYQDQPVEALGYQLAKYQSRDRWSHRDLLRLSHPKSEDPARNALYKWAVDGENAEACGKHIAGMELLKTTEDPARAAEIIAEHGLPRECVPTELLTEACVWEALLEDMPMTAMIRNLATMTRVGLIAPMSSALKVVDRIGDEERLRKARVHPIALLSALKTYQQGHGERGTSKWVPVQQVVDALDAAFYLAFRTVEPTGKRWLLALDVLGSMTSGNIAGCPGLTPRTGSAAMAMVTAAVETVHHFIGFTGDGGPYGGNGGGRQSTDLVTPLDISPRKRLDDIVRYLDGLTFGATDCALPMLYAREKKLEVDVFVVYTDSETWAGQIHPVQALRQYREATGIPARLIVVGMVSNEFTIADPADAGMLDVVGFDTATPQVMSQFART